MIVLEEFEGYKVVQLEAEELTKLYAGLAKTEVKEMTEALDSVITESKEEVKFEKDFLKTFGVYPFYGSTIFGIEVEGKVVSVNATRFSSRPRKEAWGRYINFMMAHTLPSQRCKGHATNLQLWIQNKAKKEGYSRVKSLIQSWGGVRLHLNCNHDYWGLTEKGELVVDAPISDEIFPDGIPKQVRPSVKVGEPHKLTPNELIEILSNPEGIFKINRDIVINTIGNKMPIGVIRG